MSRADSGFRRMETQGAIAPVLRHRHIDRQQAHEAGKDRPMTSAQAKIIICPSCAAANRVPAEKLSAGGKCGKCGAALFQGKPLDLTATDFDEIGRAHV